MKNQKVYDQVKDILTRFPETRGNDKHLIWRYLMENKGIVWNLPSIDKEDFYALPSMETITRCRRRIQEVYPELAIKKIKELREAKQQEFPKWLYE